MAKTYGAGELGGTVTVSAEGTTVRVGFTSTIVLVGGYDAANADSSVTAGDVYTVQTGTEASTLFGSGSELHRATNLAYANGVGEVKCIPVTETSVTGEDPSAGTAGELANAPIFDPNVNAEHDITDANGNTINVSYDLASETVSGTEGYVDPVKGKFKGDGTTTYSLSYDHGSYNNALITAVDEGARYVVPLTENESVANNLLSELDTHATDFDFQRGFVGAQPAIDATDISTYSDGYSDQRLVVVPPSRGTVDGSEVRTCAGIAGMAASRPLGGSITYDELSGLDTLNKKYTASEAADFTDSNGADEEVTALTENFEVVNGMTSSPTAQFQDIFQTEIIDAATEGLHEVAKQYAGGPQTGDERDNLRSAMVQVLEDMATQNPPLLSTAEGGDADPYQVTVSLGATDTETDVQVSIEPLDIMKEVNVDIAVGEVVTFNGASA